jgi:hypothetical protein
MGKKRKKSISEEEARRHEAESGKRVSGEPESNLSAIGAGGIGGAAAGAAVGTAVGGPIGGIIGAAAGGIAGATAADQIQDALDPKLEEVYWQENYRRRPYYKTGSAFNDYLPAYKFGWEAANSSKYGDRDFEDIESDLRRDWETQHGKGSDWSAIKQVIRDSFERIRERRLASKT